ncbi:MAG: hypothetical protein MdMp014T_0808 [Treponematales bacterium]
MGKLGVKTAAALAAACVLALAGCPAEGEGGSEALARTFTVSFDLNDGGAGTPPDALSVAGGGSITLPAVSRQGYRFDGWYTEEGGRAGGAGAPYTPAASLTLYARWTEDGGGDTAVAFTSVTANGSGTETTTQLSLTFSAPVAGLTENDITVSGAAGVTTGTLSGEGPSYTLPVTVTESGTLTVAAAKAGYSISPPSMTVDIYYAQSGGGPEPEPALPSLTGMVTITGRPMPGMTLRADTSMLGGSGEISYQWKKADSADGAYAAISGATAASYWLGSGVLNRYFKVEVTRAGYTGSLESGAVRVTLTGR